MGCYAISNVTALTSLRQFSSQRVISAYEHAVYDPWCYQNPVNNHSVSIRHIWDSDEARFDPSFVPIFLYVPAVVSCLILLNHLVFLNANLRPLWMSPFVVEHETTSPHEQTKTQNSPCFKFGLLATTCTIGLCVQVSQFFCHHIDAKNLLHAIPWLVLLGLLYVDKERKFNASVLLILAVTLVAEAIYEFNNEVELQWKIIFPLTELICTSLGITISLNLPFRGPKFSNQDVAVVGKVPSVEFRSPEDNLTAWQFATVSWMGPLIKAGYSKKLHDEDVWQLSHGSQHQHLHNNFRALQGSVIRKLLKANGLDLITSTLLGILELLANFSVPLLLQELLQSMENPHAPLRASIAYAMLSLAARLVASQCAVFGLWYSRRAYERSRGEMITMLHEKTLSRKIIGKTTKPLKTHPCEATSNHHQASIEQLSNDSNLWKVWRRRLRNYIPSLKLFKHQEVLQEAKEPASKGKILNLMRNDVYEVAQRFWEFQNLFTKPLGLIFSVILVWRFIGWPCLLGILAMILTQAIDALVLRKIVKWGRLRRITTDTKLQKVSQFVEAIRHLRWYGWQNEWLKDIMESRQRELRYLVVSQLLERLLAIFYSLGSLIFPVVVFYGYTALAGQPLTIDIAFPALQLFEMIQASMRDIPGLVTVLVNASVAVGRINGFMQEEDLAEEVVIQDCDQDVLITNGSFSWPGHSELVLNDINLRLTKGLTVVCGEVAAGKTALLQAILGELDRRSGAVARPNSMIAYCSQTPWLQNMSIRENILFSSPYEERRYKAVLEACALLPDLATFKHGDLSDIGENGIGLSGGQKARVALARAVYSKANIVLLDDPISALDFQTSKIIVDHCLTGPLMQERIVILVTHRVEICSNLAHTIVKISNGRSSVSNQSLPVSETRLTPRINQIHMKAFSEKEENSAVPDKFIEEEHRAHGGVKFRVYWQYIKAGKLKLWSILIFLLTIYRLLFVAKSWFLKEWGEAYQTKDHTIDLRELFEDLPDPGDNINPWLIWFLVLVLGQFVFFALSQVSMVIIIFAAGRQMFRDIMHRVSQATFRFYDVTPVGRLMNRLTSDINTVDGDISGQFQSVVFLLISWVSALVVIASVTPVFLLFSILLTGGFVLIFGRFLPTSQNLRRLEMVSLSPLMSNFGALLDGLITVRAFRVQNRFQARVIGVTDAFQKMDHFYWTLQAWLMYRFDALSAVSTFLLTMIALYTGISPGLTAFVLVAASGFVEATHSLCKSYGQLQMDFVSVERVVELLDLDQEPPGRLEPPAWWPSYTSEVAFEDVTIRYSSKDEPALCGVSFRIKGGSTTAIVGRTGSGKSTLALALLATIEPESGTITIGGLNIMEMKKQALRSRVTFLAQDPILFPGSMRQNLDPLEEHSNEDCVAVLERICGKHGWTVETQIDSGGKNLSQGQRQLVCLARAVLRRSAIIILDEATASIDMQTSQEIQQILREEMAESTVITIAHRLEAVVNADYCIQLGHGKVIRQGPASELLG